MNDAEAMALVKEFGIELKRAYVVHDDHGGWEWEAIPYTRGHPKDSFSAMDTDLNKAIAECVAKLKS